MASESASGSATTGVGSSSALQIREIVQTSRNQEVWKDYNMCIMTDGHKKAQCKFCFHFFAVGSNTTLKNHISHPHCEVLKAQQNQNPEAGQTTKGRDGQVFMYNPDYLREQFAGLVIQRGLPFNHFDNEQTTRVFQNTMQPRYTHVSRSTLKRDAMKLWVAAKQATIDGFANLNTMVNLTTDIWSAPHNLPGSYMCVTAHWIEPSSWQMMKRVISFEEFSSEHTGKNLKYMLEKVFVVYGLKDKILSITLDNASNNTSAMNKLRLKYNPPMGGRFYHSRCVAHIINLVVQAGLKVPIVNQMKEAFKQMLKDVFKSGEKNRRRYIKICHDAEKPCYSPNWDIETRWNSTFEMFESGLKQQITLSHFHDILVSKNGRRFKKFPDEYWGRIEMLNPLLAVFQNATVVLSGVYYPTSPLVLQQIFFISCKLSDLELEGGVLSSMVKPIKRKLRKYFENMPPIITCAAALNPCFNVSGVDYLIENISRDLEFADDGFATSHQTQSTTAEGSSSQKSRDPLSRMVHGLTQHKQKKARGDPIMSSEYEQYIKTDFVRGLQPKDYESYDVLGFWKTKENQFPVLSRMALDILSVQASSVASESAFSTSGRILSIRRTRLTAESLEMCMCLKDHLDAHERRQHTTPLELPLDVEEGVFNDEVQMNEATQLTDQEIALDASSDGSFEEPPRDYMLSSGAEDDETQDGAGGYDEDVHDLRSVETEFPGIVYNDVLTSELTLSCEPMVSPQHINKLNWKIGISLSDFDDENYTVIYNNDSFSYKIFNVDDLKLDMGNGDDKIDIKQSLGDLSIEPSPNVINIDVGAYAQGSNKFLETSHDTSTKFFKTKTFIKELCVNIVTWNYLNEGMLINLIKNLYVPFGIPFDPKLFYKDGIKLKQV
ncbi:zinc finger BED domain-containing protein RICESLEEPER 2-like protein [Tanacetum coccineum]